MADQLNLDQHVIPNDDNRKHYLADYCWCHPDVEEDYNGLIYTHKALDKRETFENQGLPTGKTWSVYKMTDNEHGAQV